MSIDFIFFNIRPDLNSSQNINWYCRHFSELSAEELYDILQLRIEVFVVEQNCIYQDCDGKDQNAWHLCGYDERNLIAYCRILPKGIAYQEAASIGRVVTKNNARGKKLGKELMQRAIQNVRNLTGETEIVLSAQLYLKRFYEHLGFVPEGDVYLEDNIEHIKMRGHS